MLKNAQNLPLVYRKTKLDFIIFHFVLRRQKTSLEKNKQKSMPIIPHKHTILPLLDQMP